MRGSNERASHNTPETCMCGSAEMYCGYYCTGVASKSSPPAIHVSPLPHPESAMLKPQTVNSNSLWLKLNLTFNLTVNPGPSNCSGDIIRTGNLFCRYTRDESLLALIKINLYLVFKLFLNANIESATPANVQTR